MVIPIGLLQVYADAPLEAIEARSFYAYLGTKAFLVTALSEELAKLAVLLRWQSKHPHSTSRELLGASLCLNLGFGSFEALANLGGGPAAWFGSLAMAIPSHLLDGVLLAWFLHHAKGFRGLALVVYFHGFWDLGVFALEEGRLAGLAIILTVYASQLYLGIRLGRKLFSGVPRLSEAEAGELGGRPVKQPEPPQAN